MSLFHKRNVEEWKKLADQKFQELAGQAEKASSNFGTIKVDINELALSIKTLRENPNYKKKESLIGAIESRSSHLVRDIENLRKQLQDMVGETNSVVKAAEKIPTRFLITFGLESNLGKEVYHTVLGPNGTAMLGSVNWHSNNPYAQALAIGHFWLQFHNGQSLVVKVVQGPGVNQTGLNEASARKQLTLTEFKSLRDNVVIRLDGSKKIIFFYQKDSAGNPLCLGHIQIEGLE